MRAGTGEQVSPSSAAVMISIRGFIRGVLDQATRPSAINERSIFPEYRLFRD
jgi:hypothetical protein